MQLRYYQAEAIEAIYAYFSKKQGNPLVALPTGTGKSVVIGEFIRGVYQRYPNQRVMMLTHVKELIEQNLDKLLTIWPTAPAGVYSAGVGRKESNFPITFAGIASVSKKAEAFGHIDLVLIDEAHLVSADQDTLYQKFLADLKKVNPYLKVIGFTATTYRLGLGSLTNGGVFTDVCYDQTTMEAFNRLVAEGFMAPLIPKRTSMEYDTTAVKVRGGEFSQHELQAAVDKDSLTYAACTETMLLGHERKHWLIFATGIEHAEHVASNLDSLGIPAVVIHSKMTTADRDAAIAGFKSGKYRAAVNNNVLTTGFDFPAIDLISVMRPTKSTVLWVQMLGRGTRPSPDTGKTNCLVLDFAGNTRRLGPINDPVVPKAKGEKGEGIAPVRMCDVCGTYNHASARVCIECGSEFPRELRIRQTAYSDELMKPSPTGPAFPKVETFPVDRLTYSEHNKPGKPPAIVANYYCGLRMFKEYICLEHPGYAGKKARDWWRQRSPNDPPETTLEALGRLGELSTPARIRVQLDLQYPEIKGVEYA